MSYQSKSIRKSRENKKKINPKKMFKRVGLVCVAIYVICIVIQQQYKINENMNLIYEYKTKIEEAKQKNEELKSELAQIDDDEYLERMARKKLGLVRQNEKIFVDSSKTK